MSKRLIMEDIREKLRENLDEAEWEWLKPHQERDVLVVIVPELDLLTVGEAIATDNVTSVQYWIGEQQIYKPSPAQIEAWNDNHHKRFKALIVQPYVLVQEQQNGS